MQPYTYERLEAGHIRLLTILPNEDIKAPLDCSLNAVDFKTIPSLTVKSEYFTLDEYGDPTRDTVTKEDVKKDFMALSYSWGMNESGDASPCRIIYISGRLLPVSRNLYQGLKRIRSSRETIRIWIDAICINQHDNEEKTVQVSRMADIYRSAQTVMVWLGEGASEDEDYRALTLLKFFHDPLCPYVADRGMYQSECLFNDDDQHDGDGSFQARERWIDGIDPTTTVTISDGQSVSVRSVLLGMRNIVHARKIVIGVRDIDQRIVCGIDEEKILGAAIDFSYIASKLFGRRYFHRRWVLQEVYFAGAAIELLWGPCRLPLPTIVHNRLIDFVLSFSHLCAPEPEDLPTPWGLWHDLQWQVEICRDALDLLTAYERHKMTLLHTLDEYAGLVCADDRDIIFALLSLHPEFGLKADYSLSTAETYTRFTRVLLQNGWLDYVLMNLLYPTRITRLPGLPSWAMDLRNELAMGARQQYENAWHEILTSEAGDTSAAYAWADPRVDDHGRFLCRVYSLGSCLYDMSASEIPGSFLTVVNGDRTIQWNNAHAPGGWGTPWFRVKRGDMLFLLPSDKVQSSLTLGDIWLLVLRPLQADPKTYCLVSLCWLHGNYGQLKEIPDLSELQRITVCIV